MKYSIERSQIEKIFSQRNGYLVLAVGAIVVCLLQLIIIVMLIDREKVIVIPPMAEKSFWVSAQAVSPEYLSEMTTFFANLRLNITPESALIQRETILRYTDPSYYHVLNEKLVEEADKVSDQHISIAFFPVSVKVDAKHLKAIIIGDLSSFVGDTALPMKRVSYLVAYRYDSARLLIKSFEEINNA